MATVTTALIQTNKGGLRDWSSGICDCFNDMSTCFMGWCCPCCLLCQNAAALGENACCLCCCIPAPFNQMLLRLKLRTQAGIQGDICSDYFHACCCGPCALCQEAREIKRIQMTQTQTVTVVQQPIAQAPTAPPAAAPVAYAQPPAY